MAAVSEPVRYRTGMVDLLSKLAAAVCEIERERVSNWTAGGLRYLTQLEE